MPKLLDPEGKHKTGGVSIYNASTLPQVGAFRGERVDLIDTYDSLPLCFALIYDPDNDASFPWRAVSNQGWVGLTEKGAVDGLTLGRTDAPVSAGSWVDVLYGGSDARTKMRVPYAGTWEFFLRMMFTSASGDLAFNVGVAVNSGTPPSPYVDASPYDDNTKTHTEQVSGFAAGDYAKLRQNLSTVNGRISHLSFGFRPVKLAGVA